MKLGEFEWAQRDGAAPTVLKAAAPSGESGVALSRLRFGHSSWFSGTTHQHLIALQMSPHLRLHCRMAEQRLVHETATGALAICPAGIDCSVESDRDMDLLLLAVEPRRLRLAAAENEAPQDCLHERLSGYDAELFAIVRRLAVETTANYPNGPLYWSELSEAVMGRLIEGHSSMPAVRHSRGAIGKAALKRIRDYVTAHLAEPIEVSALAGLAGRSPSQFSRVFASSFGMTPHRYVVHLRLRAAIERIKAGDSGLADIAAETGFADQSHLSRWIRRVHGVAPSRI